MNDKFRQIKLAISGVKEIVFQKKLINNLIDLLQSGANGLSASLPAVIIADNNAINLLPKSIFSSKQPKFNISANISVVVPIKNTAINIVIIAIIILRNPLPHQVLIDYITVYLKKHIISYSSIIALGSGTIADICKTLAAANTKELIIFPTAPSVNAYTSANASIINYAGKKETIITNKMPAAIYIDEEILQYCPNRLVISGLYDLLCNSTVIVDCLTSHLLFGTYYNDLFLNLISSCIEELTGAFKNYRLNFPASLSFRKLLMEALLISGFSMWAYGSSASASQGEHQIAHLLEEKYSNSSIKFPSKEKPNFNFLHGELVAASTIFTSFLQERLFKRKHEQNLTINLGRYKKYNSYKKDFKLNSTISDLEARIDYFSSYLAEFTKNHIKLRNFIFESYIMLPKFDHNFYVCANRAFSYRGRFTCLDLAYLYKLII